MTRVHKCVPAGPGAIFTCEKCHSGRPDRTRKRSRFLHGWHSGPAPGRPGRRRAGGQRASAPPPAGGSHREGGTHRPLGGPGRCRCRPRAGDQTAPRVRAGAPPRSPAPRGRLTPCRWKPSAPPAGCSALAPRPIAAARRRRPCPVPLCPPRSATRRHQRALALSALDC